MSLWLGRLGNHSLSCRHLNTLSCIILTYETILLHLIFKANEVRNAELAFRERTIFQLDIDYCNLGILLSFFPGQRLK